MHTSDRRFVSWLLWIPFWALSASAMRLPLCLLGLVPAPDRDRYQFQVHVTDGHGQFFRHLLPQDEAKLIPMVAANEETVHYVGLLQLAVDTEVNGKILAGTKPFLLVRPDDRVQMYVPNDQHAPYWWAFHEKYGVRISEVQNPQLAALLPDYQGSQLLRLEIPPTATDRSRLTPLPLLSFRFLMQMMEIENHRIAFYHRHYLRDLSLTALPALRERQLLGRTPTGRFVSTDPYGPTGLALFKLPTADDNFWRCPAPHLTLILRRFFDGPEESVLFEYFPSFESSSPSAPAEDPVARLTFRLPDAEAANEMVKRLTESLAVDEKLTESRRAEGHQLQLQVTVTAPRLTYSPHERRAIDFLRSVVSQARYLFHIKLSKDFDPPSARPIENSQ